MSPVDLHRVLLALTENLAEWERRVLEIEANAAADDKTKALTLARDIEAARQSLKRLAPPD